MKKSKFGFYLLCVLGFAGIALVSINCAAPGTMNGSLGVNISDQPNWGPAGYQHVDYYYIPDIDSYYSVSERQYIYRDGSEWRHSRSLPSSYSGYDPYHSYKVVINEDMPYRNHESHRVKYITFRGVRDQAVIREDQDTRYVVPQDQPERVVARVDVNISDQPIWGPTGFDRADYYYIPDINSYYSVSEHQYIYLDGSEWIHAGSLPSSYSGYDPYHSYKVVVNEDKPYQNNDSHRAKYGMFRGMRDQAVIRDSRDRKYFVNKDHPEHENWVREQQR